MIFSKLNAPCCILLCSVLSGPAVSADEAATDDSSKSVSQRVEVKVQSSTTKSSADAEAKTSVRGRIVIVGPDGERKEYNLDDKLPGDLQLNLNGGTSGFMISPADAAQVNNQPRYLIGVVCEPASELLQSHLKLDGVGLVVSRLSDEMPAAKAGLAAGDILLGVGDRDFKSVPDLVTAVGESNGRPLTFRRIHQGELSDVTVTPFESNTAEMLPSLTGQVGAEQFNKVLDSLNLPEAQRKMFVFPKLPGGEGGQGRIMIQSFGPGIELDSADDFEEKFADTLTDARRNEEELKQQIEQLRAAGVLLRKRLEAQQKPSKNGQ